MPCLQTAQVWAASKDPPLFQIQLVDPVNSWICQK